MAKDKNNSPDMNINHIEIIENLAISMLEHLEALMITCDEQGAAKYDAQEFLRLFQRNQIKTCRDVFE